VVRPLLGTEGAQSPFWSPDSKSLAFFTEGKLRRVDLASPAPTTICDTLGPGRGGTWTNDGRILSPPWPAQSCRCPQPQHTHSAHKLDPANATPRTIGRKRSPAKILVPGAKREAG